ncbi:phage virion morphogenesis protein, partial [Candidatus Magnetoovum chiemensis]
ANSDSVKIGSNVIYAATHQFGAKKGSFGKTKRNAPIPWGNIPARPLLPSDDLPKDDMNDLTDILTEYLNAD